MVNVTQEEARIIVAQHVAKNDEWILERALDGVMGGAHMENRWWRDGCDG